MRALIWRVYWPGREMDVCGLAWPPRRRARDATGPRAPDAATDSARSRVGGFGSARDAHHAMIAVISHRFDGHVQLHARRRGHRLGARCCVRGVMVCVEIKRYSYSTDVGYEDVCYKWSIAHSGIGGAYGASSDI